MKVLNFGSLNIDRTYDVESMVKPGETIQSLGYQEFIGGKGLNQSIAIARSGQAVYHAGKIGSDGSNLQKALEEAGVNTEYLMKSESPSGHAIIQIDKGGSNSIIVEGGSNFEITKEEIDDILSHFNEGDWCLLQNEISNIDYIVDKAFEKGIKIAFNPSPVSENLSKIDLNKVTLLFINEHEGYALTNEFDTRKILPKFTTLYPNISVILTLGEQGSRFSSGGKTFNQEAFKFDAIDTTGAGDTFTGYFLSSYVNDKPVEECLQLASLASGMSVARKGASNSIPTIDEVLKKLNEL